VLQSLVMQVISPAFCTGMKQNVNASAVVCHNLCVHLINLPDKFRGQQIFRTSLAYNYTVFYGIKPVTVHGGDIQVVDGGNDRPVQAPHQVHQLKLVLDIQMVGSGRGRRQ